MLKLLETCLYPSFYRCAALPARLRSYPPALSFLLSLFPSPLFYLSPGCGAINEGAPQLSFFSLLFSSPFIYPSPLILSPRPFILPARRAALSPALAFPAAFLLLQLPQLFHPFPPQLLLLIIKKYI